MNLSQYAPFSLPFSSDTSSITTTTTSSHNHASKRHDKHSSSKRHGLKRGLHKLRKNARSNHIKETNSNADSNHAKQTDSKKQEKPKEWWDRDFDKRTVALLNVHLAKKDDLKWQRTTVEDNCIGLYTFMLTHSKHKMDLFYFHNHPDPLPCKIIDTYKNTNVKFIKITNQWFTDAIEQKLRINVTKYWGKKGGNVNTAICDLKPLYGHIFESYIKGYKFWGYGDVDGLFGTTALFSDSLYRDYDVISGYCNTNNDQVYPTYHQCARGYASGPLMLMRHNKETRHILDTAMAKWWRNYFTVPKKFFLDEDYSPFKKKKNGKNRFKTLHTILRDHEIEHNLRQYCEDSCEAISQSNEMFVFNLNYEFTDSANMTYRWSRKNGITIWANQTNSTTTMSLFRPHFLHWSLWKYTGQAKIRKLRRQIYANIMKLDCFEFKSLSYKNFFRGGFKECVEEKPQLEVEFTRPFPIE